MWELLWNLTIKLQFLKKSENSHMLWVSHISPALCFPFQQAYTIPKHYSIRQNFSVVKHWTLCGFRDFLVGRPGLLSQPNLFGAQTIAMEKSVACCYGSSRSDHFFPRIFQNSAYIIFMSLQIMYRARERRGEGHREAAQRGRNMKNTCVTLKCAHKRVVTMN